MRQLKTLLRRRLFEAKRVAVLGVGNELKGDDAAGTMVADQLSKSYKETDSSVSLKVFNGCTAPENFTGEIIKFSPTHLIIVDAAELGKGAGTIKLIDIKEISGITFCSHQLPLKIMIDYILASITCEIIIIGIEPEKLDFLAPVSPVVKTTVNHLVKTISDIIKT